ncbi:MAG: hypothetical protein NVV59_19855 [Chitinophagaceae bacterium]|nr:hypothetical protein [Chitinophagaceae bacterium]
MEKRAFLYVILITIVLPWWGCKGSGTVQARQSQRFIYVPVKTEKEVLESVRDMAYWLEKADGSKYEIREADVPPDNGIRLVDFNKVNLSTAQRVDMETNGQSFHLLVNGPGQVRIAGSGKNSFINGIYTYLHELGFRWYAPGELWTKTGNPGANITINKLYKPDFQDRFYFGSGGHAAIPAIDPDGTFSKDFSLWNRRNLWNADYTNKGHSGNKFYNDNKKVLDQHPEYFCDGKVNRQGWIDVNNKAVVDIFVRWAKGQVTAGERFPSIGVDPADGSGAKGDCLPVNHPTIKTWSDKYYWLANQVAASLPKNDQATRIQLYAYNNHAAPPGFALQSQVFPTIIPYAFQNVTSPENFISLWEKR